MPTFRTKRDAATRPPMDEWGVYDPKQAGFAAVMDRVKSRQDEAPTTVVVSSRRPLGLGAILQARKKK